MKPSKKTRSLSSRTHSSQLQSASRRSRPSVHVKNNSGKATTQRNGAGSNSSSIPHTPSKLDQLAVVAAILSLIAASIGLFIAWRSLGIPDTTAVVV